MYILWEIKIIELRRFSAEIEAVKVKISYKRFHANASLVKGRLISKGNIVFFNSPKRRTKKFCPIRLGQKLTFSSLFLGELKKPKSPFEIY